MSPKRMTLCHEDKIHCYLSVFKPLSDMNIQMAGRASDNGSMYGPIMLNTASFLPNNLINWKTKYQFGEPDEPG